MLNSCLTRGLESGSVPVRPPPRHAPPDLQEGWTARTKRVLAAVEGPCPVACLLDSEGCHVTKSFGTQHRYTAFTIRAFTPFFIEYIADTRVSVAFVIVFHGRPNTVAASRASA